MLPPKKIPLIISKNLENNTIIEQTRNWVQRFVIGLNMCPFAAYPMENKLVRFVVFPGDNLQDLLQVFAQELVHLRRTPVSELETTLIIIPHFLADFQDFLNVVPITEEILKLQNMTGEFQVATFHPRYQFAGTQPHDLENYTNRSPYPMLHILREDSVEKAIEKYGNTEMIPVQNVALLEVMGLEEILKLIK